MYTKAKDSLVEAYGGVENLPKDFASIRPNFIEQLRKGLDMDEVEQDEEEEEEEQQQQPEESEVITQVNEYVKMDFRETDGFFFSLS